MRELFEVVPPGRALDVLLERFAVQTRTKTVDTSEALDRVLAESLRARESLPAFPRSTMDGFAVRAADTYGASESLPAYLTVVGEVAMGHVSRMTLGPAQAAIVHTGGMLPAEADAVVMSIVAQTLDQCGVEWVLEE